MYLQHWLQWYKFTEPYPYQNLTVSLFYNIYYYTFGSGPSRAKQGETDAGGATQDLHSRGETQGTYTYTYVAINGRGQRLPPTLFPLVLCKEYFVCPERDSYSVYYIK
jgi:hypothetical protein